MNVLKTIQDWISPYEDEDEDDLPEFDSRTERTAPRSGREVSIRTTANLKVMLTQPKCVQDLPGIADEMKNFTTVVINIASADRNLGRQILDVLSGVAYGLDSRISRIAADTYMILPYNVEFESGMLDELHSSGLFAELDAQTRQA
ncbi:MAG: cell division protein SepF [Oscillibacter sp.]|jgi:FtsZ-interacting cell division protein YlmF|nr:cell division protein SepF [Oscillibacter sp.]